MADFGILLLQRLSEALSMIAFLIQDHVLRDLKLVITVINYEIMKKDQETFDGSLTELIDVELKATNGGSPLSYWVFWVLGNMADTPNNVHNPLTLFG